MYDTIESHLRSLISLGITSGQYGAMLVAIIIEMIPFEIRLVITRKIGRSNWEIDELMNIIKIEIEARKSCAEKQHEQ